MPSDTLPMTPKSNRGIAGNGDEEVRTSNAADILDHTTFKIPNVVQRALGTNNIIARGSAVHDDGTIFGLEGFTLPHYLSLRYKLQSSTREGLILANQQEELRDRLQSRQGMTAAKKAKKSKRKRKRKTNVAVTNNNEDIYSEPKSKRRRKKRRKGLKSSTELDDKQLSSTEINHYRMMTRIIIAPYTSSLIATMNRFKQSAIIEATSNNAASNDVARNYLYTNKLPQSNSLTLSPPQESLEGIVDGVISSLVHRTHKFRSVPSAQTTLKKSNRRRRRRRTRPNQVENSRLKEATTKISTTANDWLLERNLLSAGYVIGNSGVLTSSSKTTLNAQGHTQNQFLRGCPNMAPGIYCLQPNTLATYARSSEPMHFLHSVMGDEALREILLNAIILIPAVSGDENSDVCFDRGNYFQLCGPPLNTLVKRFEQLKNKKSLVQAQPNEQQLLARKRKRGNRSSSIAETEEQPIIDSNKVHTANSRWDANKPIPRSNLFYCDFYTKRVGLPPQHLLNKKGDEDKLNFQLLNTLVQIWPKHSKYQLDGKDVRYRNKRRKRWKRLNEAGIVMCKEMRRRQASCDYSRLLEYHCPLPHEFKELDSNTALSLIVKLHSPLKNVAAFIQAILWSAFPRAFWGSKHNFYQVVKTMTVYLNLRRAEAFPEKAITSGIRVLDMKWLHPPRRKQDAKLSKSDHASATVLVRNVMRWLYCHFINPVLRSTFYITETEFTGTKVLYYRRPVWMKIKNVSLELLLSRGQYREMTGAKAQRLISSHNVGCPPAPLRILPKKTGIRAIAMLSKTCGINNEANKSSDASPPNTVMQSTFHALKYEYEKKPNLFGAGVMGLTEVFPSFCAFVEALKQLKVTAESPQELFFTSADIKHCYDTINQKRLCKLMRSMIEEDMYVTKDKFVLCSKGDNSSMRCIWKKQTCPPEHFTCTSQSKFAEQYTKAIFVDGVRCSLETSQTINGLLRDHIIGQVVVANGNFGPRYLHQKNGIPQGSILSSMFCNTYFGSLEEILFDNVFDREVSHVIRGSCSDGCDSTLVKSANNVHLLLRIVDDFLLISTDKNASIRFLEKLNNGIPSIGVKVNRDKTRVNYGRVPGEIDEYNQHKDFFPWCGLLINTTSCEITLDNERFSGQKATDTVSVYRLGSEGNNLRKAMKGFVRPRCKQQLLFSSRINSIDNVRLNFYQTSLLCAIKTMHYIECSGVVLSSRTQHKFIYDSISDTIAYAFLLISSNLKHDFQLDRKEALWLGERAFCQVLQSRRKRHGGLAELFLVSRHCPLSNRVDLVNVMRRAEKVFNLEAKR